jgi:hypothetical protein
VPGVDLLEAARSRSERVPSRAAEGVDGGGEGVDDDVFAVVIDDRTRIVEFCDGEEAGAQAPSGVRRAARPFPSLEVLVPAEALRKANAMARVSKRVLFVSRKRRLLSGAVGDRPLQARSA